MQDTPSSPPAKLPPLPIGNSDWAAVRADYWSADKTQLISGLLDRKSTIALFTRPRRFGKTFAMRMLKTFFEKTEKSNAHLFEGTRVWQNPAHRAEQGKYPVISITFKDAKGGDWPQTLSKIMAAVRDEFDRHVREECAPPAGDDLNDILQSLTSGDAEKFRKSIEAFLVSSASYFDMAHEDFFHGLLLGLLALGRDHYEITSNREEGDGRPDIAMKPRPGVPLPGVILELKSPKLPARASQKRVAAALEAAAREARDQIDDRRYAAEMERQLAERDKPLVTRHSSLITAQDAPPRVLCYGVGFLGKRVALAK